MGYCGFGWCEVMGFWLLSLDSSQRIHIILFLLQNIKIFLLNNLVKAYLDGRFVSFFSSFFFSTHQSTGSLIKAESLCMEEQALYIKGTESLIEVRFSMFVSVRLQ